MDSRDKVAILDAGSQYGKVIDRRIRELNVYSDILPLNTLSADIVKKYKAIIISGGPNSVCLTGAANVDPDIYKCGLPILGICYGIQLINKHFNGLVEKSEFREDGQTKVKIDNASMIFKNLSAEELVLLTHSDKCTKCGDSLRVIAECESDISGICNESLKIFGLQFHPEVDLTPCGAQIFKNFLFEISAIKPLFTLSDRVENCVLKIKESVQDNKKVLILLSGGVDSTVCAALLNKALDPDQIIAVHIDNGFMRKNESEMVVQTLKKLNIKVALVKGALDFASGITTQQVKVDTISSGVSMVNSPRYEDLESGKNAHPNQPPPGAYVESRNIPIGPLNGTVVCPEQKRLIIGNTFIRLAENTWCDLNLDKNSLLLCQGTLRPDLIESASKSVSDKADLIKTHHNATELVQQMKLHNRVIEPLADFHKDEVRAIGKQLNLPDDIVNRHPFPGPGLAIRIICADEPFLERDFQETTSCIKMVVGYNVMSQKPHALLTKIKMALSGAEQNLLNEITGKKCYSAHLLPIRSVGVQGDQRTYSYPCAISCNSQPDWDALFFFAKIIPRICSNINRVVYVFGPQVIHPLNDVTPTYLRKPVVDTLREVDAAVNEALVTSGEMLRVSQMPVILIPIHFDRDPGQCVVTPSVLRSVVIRPFITSDFMTGIPAVPDKHLSLDVIMKMKDAAEHVSGISRVLYDLTPKPPGTTEWE